MKRNPNPVIKLEDFVPDFANRKSPLHALIRHIARETNRHKFNYAQLKYVFRAVREKCDVSAPATSARKLLDLPTAEELERFFAAISDPIHRLIFEVLLGTGLRVEELCNLRVDRIDFERNLLFVSEGKGKKDRVTVIGRKLVEKIRLYLKGRKNKFLFESNRHTALQHSQDRADLQAVSKGRQELRRSSPLIPQDISGTHGWPRPGLPASSGRSWQGTRLTAMPRRFTPISESAV